MTAGAFAAETGGSMSIRLCAGALAMIGAIGLSTGALAGALPQKLPVYNWSGFYAGINGGYGWSDQAIGLSHDNPAYVAIFLDATGVHSIAGDPKGGLGGVQFGYNWQNDRMVYGLELDLDDADISSSQDIAVVVGVGRTFHGEQKLNWLGTLRARLGYTPVERLFVYATGGLAGGHASATANMTTNPGCTVGICWIGSNAKTMWGWAAGAGLEYAVTSNWSIKAEYLYYDLGTLRTIGPTEFAAQGTLNGSVGILGNTVRAGLNYKFN